MEFHGIWIVAIAIGAGTLSVLMAIAVIRGWDRLFARNRIHRSGARSDVTLRPIVMLFQNRRLIDATPPARNLLDHITAPLDDWARLMQWVGPRFDDGIAQIEGCGNGRIELVGRHGTGSATLRLTAERIGDGLLRVTIVDPQAEHAGIVVDSMSQQAMEEELDLLRRALDQTPMLVWRHDGAEQVTWANAAYMRRAEAQATDGVSWPLPRLLDAPKPVPGAGTTARRAALNENGIVSWFDCHAQQIAPDQTMMFALPADAAVRAERSLREFVQTLTKTFADLPIGLAIFDRQRHLQLFNPALIDLTGLPTGFLTARPTLFDLLDRLRELRMVPEPKDFRSWRQQMSILESAAATGHHVETWSLPGGQTYRVTGRPHPDGAVAFLFEDITSEISLTRKFRAELSLGATVLDGIEDALAVFASGGQMVMTNQAYRDLWESPATTLDDCIHDWRGRIEPGPGFEALRARLTGAAPTSQRDRGILSGPAGQLLGWQVSPLGVGRQMVRFRRPEVEPTQLILTDDQMAPDAAHLHDTARAG